MPIGNLQTEADLLEFVKQNALAELHVLIAQLQSAVRQGTGAPNGVVAAPVGATYRDMAGGASTTFYVKESGGSGNTGWVPK